MDEKTRNKAFQLFFTTKEFEKDSGMGLSSVFSIIKKHKGEVFIKDTSPGQGTTFEIIFPSVYEDEKTQQNCDQKNARILIVDDEEQISRIFLKFLQNAGYKPEISTSGKAALEILQKESFDLMLTDIGMPEMNGWELAEIVRKNYSNLKIAIISGHVNEEQDKDRMQKLSISHFLSKPVFKKGLLDLVSSMLEK